MGTCRDFSTRVCPGSGHLSSTYTSRVSSEISNLSSADRANRLPAISGGASIGAATPSRALVRIDPVDPHAGVPHVGDATSTTPLGRSGLDLLELLATTDLIAPRATTGSLEMEVGLEQSRGALLRNVPGEALALLDGVWDGAQRTEEGWYLRAAALTVLGLPGESDRVADAGLAQRPNSLALRFMQSVARLAIGDVAGARASLQPALAQAPRDPVLAVQHALVHARFGDTRGAEKLLAMLETSSPSHPVARWGRAALRALIADAQRSQSTPSRGSSAQQGIEAAIVEDILGHARHDGEAALLEAVLSDVDVSDVAPSDVAATALARFGARIATRPDDEIAREARVLMRAFSAGGSLVSSTRPEQAHAARVILTTFLASVTRERVDVPSPVRAMIDHVIPLLRSEHVADAERFVQRQSVFAREPIGRLLLAVVRGAMVARGGASTLESAARTTPLGSAIFERDGTPANGGAAIGRELDRGSLAPVRLGLSLLHETRATRLADARALETPSAAMRSVDRSMTPVASRVNADGEERGWSFASAVANAVTANLSSTWTPARSACAVAIVGVAVAAGALATGHGFAAVVLVACALWVGLTPRGDRGPNEPPTQ